MRIVLASFVFALMAACASTPAPVTRPAPETPMTANCMTRTDLEAAFDQRCRVVGRYEMRDFHTKKGAVFRTWPVVVLDDGTPVLIESLWDESTRHDDATIAAHQGKRVAVTGTLHGEPPGSIQNFATACVSPVEDFGLADD